MTRLVRFRVTQYLIATSCISPTPACWLQHVPVLPPTWAPTVELSRHHPPRRPARDSVLTGAGRRRPGPVDRRTSTASTASWEMSGPSWRLRRRRGQHWHWRPHIELHDEPTPQSRHHPPITLYATSSSSSSSSLISSLSSPPPSSSSSSSSSSLIMLIIARSTGKSKTTITVIIIANKSYQDIRVGTKKEESLGEWRCLKTASNCADVTWNGRSSTCWCLIRYIFNVKKLRFRHQLTANMTHLKLQKLQKSDYPPAHHLNVNVLLSNITFCRFRCVIRR